jgi:hypothetical protein
MNNEAPANRNQSGPQQAITISHQPLKQAAKVLTQLSFGRRAELVSDFKFGNSSLAILKYAGAGSVSTVYTSEINKDEDTQLLVLPGTISYLRSQSKISLDHYGLRESGVSGFIKSQVTGESFVMTEVKGKGIIRQTPSQDTLGFKVFHNLKLGIPNTNITYFKALMGKFEILPPQKSKSDSPIIYSEIRCEDTLILVENDNFYPIPVSPGNPVHVESNEIIFWTGELNLNEDKLVGNLEGNLVEFSGSGEIYVSLND